MTGEDASRIDREYPQALREELARLIESSRGNAWFAADLILAAGFGDVAKAWDEGEVAGGANQANWDGWRFSKPEITNPHRTTDANGASG